MAHSRQNRIGTIFSRVTAMIRGGAMKEDNLPLWYLIYKAFPPKYEPRYDRPPSEKPIKPIFYEEDIIRAKFHKDIVHVPRKCLTSPRKSFTEIFLEEYTTHKEAGCDETEAYAKAMNTYKSMSDKRTKSRTTHIEGDNNTE